MHMRCWSFMAAVQSASWVQRARLCAAPLHAARPVPFSPRSSPSQRPFARPSLPEPPPRVEKKSSGAPAPADAARARAPPRVQAADGQGAAPAAAPAAAAAGAGGAPHAAMSLTGITPAQLREQKERQDACINGALKEGAKSAALAGMVSGGISLFMKQVSEAYRCGAARARVLSSQVLARPSATRARAQRAPAAVASGTIR